MKDTSPPSKASPIAWPGSRNTSRPSKSRVKGSRPSSPKRPTRVKSGSAKNSGKGSRGPRRNRRDEVLRRLGLTSEQVDGQPQIAPLLRQCGLLPSRIIEVLRVDQDENSVKVTALWDTLTPHARSAAGLEGVSLAVGITPRRLWELYAGATMMQSRESVGVMIAEALPKIMAVTLRQAKTPKGFTSREHILKAARVLPVPKGSTTNINVGGQPKELEEGEGGVSDGGTLEASDDFLMRAAKAMNGKQLPASVPTQVDDVIDDDEEEED